MGWKCNWVSWDESTECSWLNDILGAFSKIRLQWTIIVNALSGLDIVAGSTGWKQRFLKIAIWSTKIMNVLINLENVIFVVMIFLDIGSYVRHSHIILHARQYTWSYVRYLWCDYFKFTTTRLLRSIIKPKACLSWTKKIISCYWSFNNWNSSSVILISSCFWSICREWHQPSFVELQLLPTWHE